MISYTYNRYLWLLNSLLINKKISLVELQSKWQESYLYDNKPLSRSTFNSHRKVVQEMFDIDIECDTADGNRYYIDDTSSFQTNKVRQWLFNTFNVSNMVEEGKTMKNRILLEDIPEGTEYLSTVIESMKNNHVIGIKYQPFYEDEPTVYHVSPYCMRVIHQRWYVLGFAEELGGIRHFALDRVLQLNKTDETFDYPIDFSPEEYYRDSIGIWVDDKIKAEKVVIRVYGKGRKYLRTLPLHHSQKEINTTDEYSDFSYWLCVRKDLVHELMSKGGSVKVLSPEHLKKWIIRESLSVLRRYKKDEKVVG